MNQAGASFVKIFVVIFSTNQPVIQYNWGKSMVVKRNSETPTNCMKKVCIVITAGKKIE
jgi:hypothetical protein